MQLQSSKGNKKPPLESTLKISYNQKLKSGKMLQSFFEQLTEDNISLKWKQSDKRKTKKVEKTT